MWEEAATILALGFIFRIFCCLAGLRIPGLDTSFSFGALSSGCVRSAGDVFGVIHQPESRGTACHKRSDLGVLGAGVTVASKGTGAAVIPLTMVSAVVAAVDASSEPDFAPTVS